MAPGACASAAVLREPVAARVVSSIVILVLVQVLVRLSCSPVANLGFTLAQIGAQRLRQSFLLVSRCFAAHLTPQLLLRAGSPRAGCRPCSGCRPEPGQVPKTGVENASTHGSGACLPTAMRCLSCRKCVARMGISPLLLLAASPASLDRSCQIWRLPQRAFPGPDAADAGLEFMCGSDFCPVLPGCGRGRSKPGLSRRCRYCRQIAGMEAGRVLATVMPASFVALAWCGFVWNVSKAGQILPAVMFAVVRNTGIRRLPQH